MYSKIFRYASSIRINNFLHISLSSSTILLKQNSSKIFRLPQKHGYDFLGDKITENLPMLDFKKTTNPLYCSLSFQFINSNIFPILYVPDPTKIYYWNLYGSMIYTNLPNPKQIQTIYCPTTKNNANIKKKTDYYKHKDPRRFTHLTWIRHRKMKKHQRIKWRNKNLAMIKRRRLERNIAKEKLFRAELLSQIKEAEDFDPHVYVQNVLYTIDNVPKVETPQQKFQRYKELIRKNRTQTNLVKPKFEEID